MAWLTVTPAYGRDYTNQAQVRADWEAGKDFRDPVSGRYLSIRDVQADPSLHVHVRYANGRKLVQVTK
jgi:hypothetical protein